MTIPNSNISFIDRVIYNDESWFSTPGKALSISYRTNMLTWQYDSTLDGNPTAPHLAIATASVIQKAFHAWSNIANITASVSTSATPNVVFRIADSITTADGYTPQGLTTKWSTAGIFKAHDVIYDKDFFGGVEGSKSYLIVMHEIGHVLGLDDVYFSGAYDQSHTIMTPDESFGKTSSTPMLYDIAAAQYLYGANTKTNAGDTTYSEKGVDGLNKITGAEKLWTIWDASGSHDMFDFSGVKGADKSTVIDLRGGVDAATGKVNFSHVGDEYIALALDPATKWTKAIVIENATGGSGNDTIIGNDAANIIKGNAGDDIIYGGKGKDTIDAGAGSNVIYGGKDATQKDGETDTLDYSKQPNWINYGVNYNHTPFSQDGIIEVANGYGGIDTVAGIDYLIATKGNDYIIMNDVVQNQTIDGGGGDDYIYGSTLNDTHIVRAGSSPIIHDTKGNDTYLISPDAKHVTIFDSDGLGTLKIGDKVISGQATPVYISGHEGDNSWISYYMLDGFVANGYTIAKTLEDLHSGDYSNHDVFHINIEGGSQTTGIFGITF